MNSPELILALISVQSLMKVIIAALALAYAWGKVRRIGFWQAMQSPVFLLALGSLTALALHYAAIYSNYSYARRWQIAETLGPLASTVFLLTLCVTFFLAGWHEVWAERRRDLRELRWRRKHG